MGKNYCAIKDCHNTKGVIGRFGLPVKLHHLPGEKTLRTAWIRAISRKNYQPSSYTQVCSDHFPGGLGRTWKHNLPTLFLPQRTQDESTQRKTANSNKGPWYMNLGLDVNPVSSEDPATMPMEFESSIHSYSKAPVEDMDQKDVCQSKDDSPAAHTSIVDSLTTPDHDNADTATSTETKKQNSSCLTIPDHDNAETATSTETKKHNSSSLLTKAPSPYDVLKTEEPVTKDQAEQTSITVVSQSAQVTKPEITIEDIENNDAQILFYTGLQDFNTFMALFESLVKIGADRMNIDDCTLMDKPSFRKLRLIDEFLMVMMRLRLGLLLNDLEFRFKISGSRISRIFTCWISIMEQGLKSVVFLPPLKTLQSKIPKCFSSFKDTRIVLDCTEIFIQTPSSLENKSQTYSHYKSHNTFKALVGVSMTGAVVFLSKLYGGSASDVYITRNSGLLDMLEKGDAVMVDKGFFHLNTDFKEKGIKLYCPPFLSSSNKRFSKEQVECTRRVASARIHVERKMEQIKNFRILQNVIPLSISGVADSIFFVCGALTNLLPPLVK